MHYEFFIGFRYLRAKRKQTFISINTIISTVGIFLGVAALIIVLAVMNGFEGELREKILGVNSHIVLMQFDGGMENYHAVMRRVNGIEGVAASTPFVYGQAMVKKNDRVSGVQIRGIDPESASSVMTLGKMVEGDINFLDNDRKEGDKSALPLLVVGAELARNLGLHEGDETEIILPMGVSTPMGTVPRLKTFRVAGIFESGFYEYDASLALMPLKECKNFLNMGDGVTGIGIKVADADHADVIADVIETQLGYPFRARTWMEMNKNLFSALKLEKRVMFIILSLIVLVAAFNIIITLIMSVMEKTRDIAVLKSMGATGASIMKIFMIQGLVIGAVGTLLGCAGGSLIALNLEATTAFIEKLFGFKVLPQDVYYLSELPSQVNFGDVGVIVVLAMAICFAASIYPAWKASRLDPAEALRYE